ncbi:MAG: hypothetical protein ABJG26_01945, partial [Marinomonas sp.]
MADMDTNHHISHARNHMALAAEAIFDLDGNRQLEPAEAVSAPKSDLIARIQGLSLANRALGGACMLADDFSSFDIGRLEKSYSAVLFARRICQLYVFMLLFELLLNFFGVGMEFLRFGLEHAAYALKTGPTPTPLDLSGLKTLGDPRPLIILITAWLVYYIYSDFRKAWW